MPDASPRAWLRGVQHELTRANLDGLVAGTIPAIYLPAFLDHTTVAAIVRGYAGLLPGYYKDVVPRISKCGPTVFEHEFAARERYFAAARETDAMFAGAIADTRSPLLPFQRELERRCELRCRPASDRQYGDYFAGTLRSIEEGTPVHIDFAPHESPAWEMISAIDAQLSVNVYLDTGVDDGHLVIYDKLWSLEDEQYKHPHRFGYDDTVVRSAPSQVIAPTRGGIVLFNSRCFHRVEATWQRRLTYSFFLAFHDDHLILWS